jgi:hypothetical protein
LCSSARPGQNSLFLKKIFFVIQGIKIFEFLPGRKIDESKLEQATFWAIQKMDCLDST